ncbi:MAG: GntR family transcriptional regulator [Pseudomonadota bacterium]
MADRLADRIADELERLIFEGRISDGERLDEVRLSDQFGVSRTPLREALQRLAQSGIVVLLPRRGAFVRQPGPIELMEMFEAMAEMEAACGRLAASRISDAYLADLEAANDACKAAEASNDPDTYYAQNEVFHRIIYDQSGNGYLAGETLKLQNRLRPFRRQQLKSRGRMAESQSEHSAILRALSKGAPEECAQALRAHVSVQGEKFHSLMQSLRQRTGNNSAKAAE